MHLKTWAVAAALAMWSCSGEGNGANAGDAAGGEAIGETDATGSQTDGTLGGADSGEVLTPTLPEAPFGGLRWALPIRSSGNGLDLRGISLPGGVTAVLTGSTPARLDTGLDWQPFEFGPGMRVLGIRSDGHLEWQVVIDAASVGPLEATSSGFRVRATGAALGTNVTDAGARRERLALARGEIVWLSFDTDGRYQRQSPPSPEDERGTAIVPEPPAGLNLASGGPRFEVEGIFTRDGGSFGDVCRVGGLNVDLADGTTRTITAGPTNIACGLYRADTQGRVVWIRQTNDEYWALAGRAGLLEAADGSLYVGLGAGTNAPMTWRLEVSPGRVEPTRMSNGNILRYSAEGELVWRRGWNVIHSDIYEYGGWSSLGEAPNGIIYFMTNSRYALVLDSDSGGELQVEAGLPGNGSVLGAFALDGLPVDFGRVPIGSMSVAYEPRLLRGMGEGAFVTVEFADEPAQIGEVTLAPPEEGHISLVARLSLGSAERQPPPAPLRTVPGGACGIDFGVCTAGLTCVAGACAACTQDFHCTEGERCNGGRCFAPEGTRAQDGTAGFGALCSAEGEPACAPNLVCDPAFRRCAECVNDGDCEFGTCARGGCSE